MKAYLHDPSLTKYSISSKDLVKEAMLKVPSVQRISGVPARLKKVESSLSKIMAGARNKFKQLFLPTVSSMVLHSILAEHVQANSEQHNVSHLAMTLFKSPANLSHEDALFRELRAGFLVIFIDSVCIDLT